ncbi:MAG TPA: hypothetical protein PLQ93_06220 [Bacteroidia bacterium]|nr:hypothetical protein [Bacteroidia bacterium]
MKTNLIYLNIILVMSLGLMSCKKKKPDPHVPPDVSFKTGGPYTSSDKGLNRSDTILVGIQAKKTEDDLKSYNVSYYFDGNTNSTTFYNYLMNSSEVQAYDHDIKIGTRNQAGTEKWVFSIVDRDGNITQKTIVLTVN